LVDDAFGKTADVENGGNPAHGFGVAQENEPAGVESVEEGLGGGAAGNIVKVDEQVAAKDDVELAVIMGVERFGEIPDDFEERLLG
jgi:hypothetical protein